MLLTSYFSLIFLRVTNMKTGGTKFMYGLHDQIELVATKFKYNKGQVISDYPMVK